MFLSLPWRTKWTPTANRIPFEREQQYAYIPAILQYQILNLKLLQIVRIFQNNWWINHVEIHLKIPPQTIRCIYSCYSTRSNFIFKVVEKLFASFTRNKTGKSYRNSRKNPTIKFQKWWTAVESRTGKTQPKQQHVTSATVRLENSMHYLHNGMLHYYMWQLQFLFCYRVLGAPGIPNCVPYNPPIW